jgi:hypothetical protein
LTKLGVWPQVAGKVAGAESVRAALALVARGEAPLGVVYATDAQAEKRVRVVATFPRAAMRRSLSHRGVGRIAAWRCRRVPAVPAVRARAGCVSSLWFRGQVILSAEETGILLLSLKVSGVGVLAAAPFCLLCAWILARGRGWAWCCSMRRCICRSFCRRW